MTGAGASRVVALVMVLVLAVSLAGPGGVLPEPVSAVKVKTPKQRTGTAAGRSHLVPAERTAAKGDGKKRLPKAPKGALPLERKHTAQVVDKAAVKRSEPPNKPQLHLVPEPEPEPTEITGFDAKTSVEILGERNRYGYKYKNSDGTYTGRFFTRPVNYQATDGSFQPIDSSLVDTGRGTWRNKADAGRLDFSGTAGSPDLAVMDLGQGKRFGFGVEAARQGTGQVEGDTVTYRDIRQSSDLVLQSLNGGSVKEKIVLRSPEAPSVWEFPLRTEGVTPRLAGDGSVELVDAAGGVVAHIPHGFMVDSKVHPRSGDPARSEAVAYALEQRGARWVLKVTADPDWLADPARVYPVTVDPTAVWNYSDTSDTYVQTGYGSSPYAESEVKAGTYDGGSTKAATYLGFSQVDNELSHAKIYDVNLNLYNYWSYSCKDQPVSVHPVTQSWSQSSIANYPGPKYGGALGSRSFANGFIVEGALSSACPAKWESIDLGSGGDALIQGWANSTKANYGLTVRSSTSNSYGWKKFGSRESPNGPYLVVTYSPYNASYAFAESPPKVDPPVLNNQAGYVKVKVKNLGHDTWTPTAYKLQYLVYDKNGRQLYHTPAKTSMPQNVSYGETVTVNTKVNPLPPGTWTIKFDMVHVPSGGYALFSEWGVPRSAQLKLTVPDVPSQLTEMFPRNNYQVGTLRPTLFAEAQTVDAWPSANVNYQFALCAPPWLEWEWCVNSPWQQTPKWTVPADKLTWGKEYYWNVTVSDSGGATTSGPMYKLLTGVQQPVITSHLAGPAADGQEFDHQIGNYTTTATDANVASAGPPLSVVRTYNSLDPRTAHAFGAGWTTRLDMRAVPDNDGSGNVVVTYPDGQQVRFGKNPDGSFVPPLGRHATFAAVTGGGWRLMDQASTSYLFDASGRLTKVTDHRGRAQDLTYGSDGKLTKVTGTGGRSLTFTWSGTHVETVKTDPVNGAPLTWAYTYTGDNLTKVCPPTSTTECTVYSYESGSHYRSTVLDHSPTGYWRLAANGDSSVGENLGTDNAPATNLTYGTAGPLAGTGDTAGTFNGSTSRVRLQDRFISRESGYLSIEAWFKTTGKGTIFSYQDKTISTAAPKHVPAIYIGGDGKLRAQFWNGKATPITSSAAVNNGQWHHVVLSGQGTSQTLYLDGEVVGLPLSGAIDHMNTPYAYIGYGWASPSWPQTVTTAGNFMFTGSIDEVAVYDKALGLPAVREHYAARLAAQQLAKVTLPSGRVQADNTYDVNTDRLSRHMDRNGGAWQIGAPVFAGKVDDLTRTVGLTDPRNGTLTYVYDPLRGNRQVSETDQLGKTTTYGYDLGGFLSVITDPNGNETEFWNNERGNRIGTGRCRDADTCYWTYYGHYLNNADPFDPRNDQLVSRGDGRMNGLLDDTYNTWWEYDSHGQQTAEFWPKTPKYELRGIGYTYTGGTEPAIGGGTMPAGLLKTQSTAHGTTAFTNAYTAAGDLAQVTDAAGKVTKFGYDALGRVTSQTEISAGVPDITTTFGYDGQGRVVRSTGPGVRNEISGVTNTAETRVAYDADGNKLTETLDDTTGGDPDRVTTYTYDAHGQVDSLTDPEDGRETYGYDTTGARTNLTDKLGNQYVYTYTARGEQATRTLKGWIGNPNAPSPAKDVVLDSYAYDPGGRKASHTDAMGRTQDYTYYGDDLLAQTIAKGVRSNDSTTPRDVVVESRSYDAAGHLTSLLTGAGKHRTDYSYDAPGKLVAEVVDPDGRARRTDYELDTDNNVIKVTRSDADSEREEVTSLGYDEMNRPVRQAVQNDETDLVTTLKRDQRGLITDVVEPRGNTAGANTAAYTTTIRYDAADSQIQVSQPPVQVERSGSTPTTSRPVTRYGYNAAGEPTHVTDPEGRTTTTVYDRAGREASVTLPSYTAPGGTAITPRTRPCPVIM